MKKIICIAFLQLSFIQAVICQEYLNSKKMLIENLVKSISLKMFEESSPTLYYEFDEKGYEIYQKQVFL